MRISRFTAFVSTLAVVAASLSGVGDVQSAEAVQVAQPGIVSANPANWTPDVIDGEVLSIVQVGGTMVVGGSFSQVQGKGQPIVNRSGIFSFNATTGVIDNAFAPALNARVRALLPAGDGRSVYVGGDFTTVNGVTRNRLTRLNLNDGSLTAGFKAPTIYARVTDIRLIRDQLVFSGGFTTVAGLPRPLLASINPNTGALTDFVNSAFADPRAGTMEGYKMDVSPDGNRLILIGNFATVDGSSRPQLVMFDTSGAKAVVRSNWRTGFYDVTKCSPKWWSYMRDVDFDPTGTYFVITTTGAYGGYESPCDVESRFEVKATGQEIMPTWRDYTGGDTAYAVAVTGPAVYVGGHMDYFNNPWAGDTQGAGAVNRPGIGALDPRNGLPLSWNPTRQKGVGVFDLLATAAGLWMGSDTDLVAGEWHKKLAFFPLAGGTAIPPGRVNSLPNDVVLLGNPGTGADVLSRQYLSGSGTPGARITSLGMDNGTQDWNQARGAMLVDQTLYTAWSDGTLRAHPYASTTIGQGVNVELYGSLTMTGGANWFGTDAPKITGMFFDPTENRIYYTMAGSNSLYWRGFTPENAMVAARKFPATGAISSLAPSRVAGMTLSGTDLYFADAGSGKLYRIGFDDGVVLGPAVLADSSRDWRARGMVIAPTVPVGLSPPIAVATSQCTSLTCTFDGAGSTDADGPISAYEWDFGDGSAASGVRTSHTYADPGTYSVTLAVTDTSGDIATTMNSVEVAATVDAQITFRAAAATNANTLTPTVVVPAAVSAGDVLLLFITTNTAATMTLPPSGWTLVGEQAYTDMITRVFSRVAQVGDGGTVVSSRLSSQSKTDMSVLAYAGVEVADPIAVWAGAKETATRAEHKAPDVAISTSVGGIVSYWSDKSSSTTSWTVPDPARPRSTSVGTSSGRITSASADVLFDGTRSGTWSGLTAVADAASPKATMWTIALRAAA